MADVGKTMKGILAKSVKAINTTANHVATSTKMKMDEMSMTSSRKELQSQVGQKLLELWKNGATVPTEIQGMLAEMNQLDEQLKALRENRKAAKEERKAEKQEKKAEKKAQKKAEKQNNKASEAQPTEKAEPQYEAPTVEPVFEPKDDAPTMEMPTAENPFDQPEISAKPEVPTLDFAPVDQDDAQ